MSRLQNHLIVFSKAQISSLLATVVDFALTYVCLKWLYIHYIVSTALGALIGGVVNCVINYRWTFRAKGVTYSQVIWRYTLAWTGSLQLNIAGLYLLKNFFEHYTSLWTEMPSLCIMLAKTITAVLVAVLWNYLLQRYYVFNMKNKVRNEK